MATASTTLPRAVRKPGERRTDAEARRQANIDALYKVPGKAEIVNGEIVHFMATGAMPGHAAAEVFVSLRQYAKQRGIGRAFTDNMAFLVRLAHRDSFSPDAGFYIGPNPGMKFFDGPPVFAVEVRSEGDYGPRAERDMAAKRKGYFDAGTNVVWDVDLQSNDVVRSYRATDPDNPVVFRRGQVSNAEPAVPGWEMPVDDLFDKQ